VEIKQLKSITKDMTLLYVEDNSDLSRLNMDLFEDIFKHVDLAMDGHSGLEFYNKNSYDLVITDINLPKINGLAMLKSIFSKDENQSVVVVSAYSENEYKDKLDALEIKHFLSKPISSKNMMSTIYESIKKEEFI